jgi:hypothetical protein
MRNLHGGQQLAAAEKRKAGLHVRPSFDKTPNWPATFPKRRTATDDAPAITRKLALWATDLVVKQRNKPKRRVSFVY